MTPADDERWLLGPELMLGLCSQDTAALAWAEDKPLRRCVVSRLGIALLQALIDADAEDQAHRDDWHGALDSFVANLVQEGGAVVDVTEAVLKRWRRWRHAPLQFQDPDGNLQPIDQDLRLLLATAESLGLTFADFDAAYIEPARQRGLKVAPVQRSPMP